MGRPSKLTPTAIDTICRLVSQGAPREAAARSAGMSAPCLYKHLSHGRKALSGAGGDLDAVSPDDRLAAMLAHGIDTADSALECSLSVKLAAVDDWRCSLEYMSRRWPERWSRNRAPSGATPGRERLTIQLNNLGVPPEAVDTVLAAGFPDLGEDGLDDGPNAIRLGRLTDKERRDFDRLTRKARGEKLGIRVEDMTDDELAKAYKDMSDDELAKAAQRRWQG